MAVIRYLIAIFNSPPKYSILYQTMHLPHKQRVTKMYIKFSS